MLPNSSIEDVKTERKLTLENEASSRETAAETSATKPWSEFFHGWTIDPPMRDESMNVELQWLVKIERAAVIPSKWMLLGLCIILSVLQSGASYPTASVFNLLAFYALSNLVFSYIYYFHRYAPEQIRRLEYLSMMMDLSVISLLIYLSTFKAFMNGLQTDYYLLYFLVILRGVVIFPTRVHTVVMNLVISVVYIVTVMVSQKTIRFITSNEFLIRLVLLWGLMLMSWFVVEIVRIQRARIQEDIDRIRNMEANLVRTEKLAGMGEIAAGVAHEINNPVGIINNCAELLIRKTLPSDPSYEKLKIIAGEAERCRVIISEMMKLSTPSKITREPLDIKAILEESIELLKSRPDQAPVDITREYPDKLPHVNGNQTLLQRAMMNILNNAILSMPDGGRLAVGVELMQRTGEMLIRVKDTGMGISPENLDKIFTPFYTTRNGHSGLGLTITHRIIEWHGGRVTVQSKPGEGTEMTVILPVIQGFFDI